MTSERIDAKEVVRQLTRQRGAEEAPVYTLRDRTITGKLVLKHRTIEVAVDIQHCDFLGEVDLRYCEFKQTVYFADCQFRERFNSGDDTESHTVYHKDLNCKRSVFEGPFDLNGGMVEGSAYFSGAKFLSEERSADIRWTTVGGRVEYEGTTFKGTANFHSLKCGGTTFFTGATFEGEVHFSRASLDGNLRYQGTTFKGTANFHSLKCGGNAFFTGATFEGGVNFSYASLDGNLECQRTISKAAADFNSLKCGGNAFFAGATFEKEVRFSYASLDGSLECQEATFKEQANFNSLKCRVGAFFAGATFEGQVDFSYASLDGNLECQEATFKEQAIFNRLRCSSDALFHGATFEGQVDFSFASLDINLECQETTFKEQARFSSLRCRAAFFDRTIFDREVNFRFTTTERNLSLTNTTFVEPVNLESISVSQALHIEGASFQGCVNLYQSKIGILYLGNTRPDNLPFKDHSRLDLRECRFDAFYGGPKVAEALAKKQNSKKFSRDPYLQLENYYRGVGNDLDAKRIHFTGRNELRKNEKDPDGITKWGNFTRWGDWGIKWLTGYGVRTWQLLVPITTLLIVGVVVFWGNNALLPTSAQEQGAPNRSQVERTHLLSTQPEQAQESGPLGQHLFERTVYSLDLFLPVVNLQMAEKWQPNGLGRQIYAVFHSMVGWILVPLLLASLSGIIRRD